MLERRLREFVTPLLGGSEQVVVAQPGFRPLSRSLVILAVFPAVLLGFASSSALGWPAWLGGGLGGAVGGGLAMWLDQRQARRDHDGKPLAVGLVVTTARFLLVEMETGALAARPITIEHDVPFDLIESIETERMQGSGLKRSGAVIHGRDGTIIRVIPARLTPFLDALPA